MAHISPPVQSCDELKIKWDTFSPVWEAHYESVTLPVTHTLLSFLQLYSATSILEVACGTGAGSRLCNFLKPSAAKLTCTDLSPEMVARTKVKVNDPSVQVLQANAEDLPFADGSFDRCYASFCLHLVPDPDKILRDIFRVLKPGGIAAFSIWGRKENSEQFTYVNDIANAAGINLDLGPGMRSPFYLGTDEAAFRQRALNASFSKAVTFYQANPHPCLDPETVTTRMLAPPGIAHALAQLPREQSELIKAKSVELIQQRIASGKPLAMETLVLVAEK